MHFHGAIKHFKYMYSSYFRQKPVKRLDVCPTGLKI